MYYITFVHAPNDLNQINQFWEEIGNLNLGLNIPWLVIGDFNAITDPSEKLGGLPPRRNSTVAFNDFIFDNHLLDLGFSGNRFTWSNLQDGDDNNKFRLDRALCSIPWRTAFDKAILYNEPMIGWDHTPLRLNLHGVLARKNTLFTSMRDGLKIKTVLR
ncbi:hypothetical protein LINPERHAP2_LOCUS4389 [Linum perenne]